MASGKRKARQKLWKAFGGGIDFGDPLLARPNSSAWDELAAERPRPAAPPVLEPPGEGPEPAVPVASGGAQPPAPATLVEPAAEPDAKR